MLAAAGPRLRAARATAPAPGRAARKDAAVIDSLPLPRASAPPFREVEPEVTHWLSGHNSFPRARRAPGSGGATRANRGAFRVGRLQRRRRLQRPLGSGEPAERGRGGRGGRSGVRSVYQPQWGERGLLEAAGAGVRTGRQQRPEGAGGGLGRGYGLGGSERPWGLGRPSWADLASLFPVVAVRAWGLPGVLAEGSREKEMAMAEPESCVSRSELSRWPSQAPDSASGKGGAGVAGPRSARPPAPPFTPPPRPGGAGTDGACVGHLWVTAGPSSPGGPRRGA